MTTSGRVSAPLRPSEQIANTANERLEPRHLDAAIVISIPSGETIGIDSGQVKFANLGVQHWSEAIQSVSWPARGMRNSLRNVAATVL